MPGYHGIQVQIHSACWRLFLRFCSMGFLGGYGKGYRTGDNVNHRVPYLVKGSPNNKSLTNIPPTPPPPPSGPNKQTTYWHTCFNLPRTQMWCSARLGKHDEDYLHASNNLFHLRQSEVRYSALPWLKGERSRDRVPQISHGVR